MANAELSPRQRRILDVLGTLRVGAPGGWVFIDDLAQSLRLPPELMVSQVLMLEARALVEVPPVPIPIRCRLTEAALARFGEEQAPGPDEAHSELSGPPPL
jgi:hypothetical protein